MENPTPPFSPAPAPVGPPFVPPGPERQWCMWCHLSALSGLIIPMGNILGPLLIWQMKKAEFPALDWHGKAALNFQLSVLIYLVGGGILTHGVPAAHHLIEQVSAGAGSTLSPVVAMGLDGLVGIAAGALVLGAVTVIQKLLKRP